jgi:hypothetical protein
MSSTAWKHPNKPACRPVGIRNFGRAQYLAQWSGWHPLPLELSHGQIVHQDPGDLIARDPTDIAHPGQTGKRKSSRRTPASSTF